MNRNVVVYGGAARSGTIGPTHHNDEAILACEIHARRVRNAGAFDQDAAVLGRTSQSDAFKF